MRNVRDALSAENLCYLAKSEKRITPQNKGQSEKGQNLCVYEYFYTCVTKLSHESTMVVNGPLNRSIQLSLVPFETKA